MTERAIGVTDVAPGAGVAEFRTRERSLGGNTVCEQYLINMTERVPSFIGMATTFYKVGGASPANNFATIFNASGSAVIVAVRSIVVTVEMAGSTATPRRFSARTLTAAPTGGTASTKVAFDTALSSSSSVTVLGGASADATASNITATGVSEAWSQLQQHDPTPVGQMLMDPTNVMPPLSATDPPYLRASQGLLISMPADAPSGSSNWAVNFVWEEFTLP